MQRYVFKKKWKRVLAACVDALGEAVLWLPKKLFQNSVAEKEIRRILVIRIDSLGDGVLTLPAIQFLRKRYPDAHIDFLVSSAVFKLYSFLYPDARIYELENNWLGEGVSAWKMLRGFFQTAKKLRQNGYDLAVDFRGDLRTILLMSLAKIPNRWGREGTGGKFLLTRSTPDSPARHEVLENLGLVWENGTAASVEFPLISVEGTDLASAARWLGELKGRKKIVIHPGAGYPSKRWGVGKFLELARQIQERKLGVPIFIGTETERRLMGFREEKLDEGIVDLMGKTSLGELLAVLGQADLYVGNDSGPSHLAALLGDRLVVIFSGTNDFRKWAPWSPRLKIISYPVPCSPCEEKVCPLEEQYCLKDISVAQVLSAVEEMLGA